jgi:ankyrin repeat protein
MHVALLPRHFGHRIKHEFSLRSRSAENRLVGPKQPFISWFLKGKVVSKKQIIIGRHGVLALLLSTLLGCGKQLSVGDYRSTPVCDAIVAGDQAKAMHLLKKGADPNTGHGCALIASASRGQLAVVDLLLDLGANPNRIVSGDLTVVMGGSTPLVAAVQSPKVDTVRLLPQRGANPREDFEAFDIVLNFGHIEMAELLLRGGANPNMTSSGKESVYAYLNRQMIQVTPRDLESDRIDDTARRFECTLTGKRTLLHESTSPGAPGGDGRDRIAELLIECGADVNARTLNGSCCGRRNGPRCHHPVDGRYAWFGLAGRRNRFRLGGSMVLAQRLVPAGNIRRSRVTDPLIVL